MPLYTSKIPIDDWRDKLYERSNRLGTENFSIVYRFYSTYSGPVRYVGRSDSPLGRESQHYGDIGFYGIHEELGCRVAYVDFRIFRGKGRFRKAYEEECKQFHENSLDHLNINHPQSYSYSWECPYCGW